MFSGADSPNRHHMAAGPEARGRSLRRRICVIATLLSPPPPAADGRGFSASRAGFLFPPKASAQETDAGINKRSNRKPDLSTSPTESTLVGPWQPLPQQHSGISRYRRGTQVNAPLHQSKGTVVYRQSPQRGTGLTLLLAVTAPPSVATAVTLQAFSGRSIDNSTLRQGFVIQPITGRNNSQKKGCQHQLQHPQT